MEITTQDVMESFPWLALPQAWSVAFNVRRFIGFDAKENPVLKGLDGEYYALNKCGNATAVKRPVTRAFIKPGEIRLRAVVVLEFTVTSEFATPEEVFDALNTGMEGQHMRNNIARRIEATTVLVHPDAKAVGWVDDNREIVISKLEKVTARGLSKAT